jgi:hypothetical protein
MVIPAIIIGILFAAFMAMMPGQMFPGPSMGPGFGRF